jgi:hypothetical protein
MTWGFCHRIHPKIYRSYINYSRSMPGPKSCINARLNLRGSLRTLLSPAEPGPGHRSQTPDGKAVVTNRCTTQPMSTQPERLLVVRNTPQGHDNGTRGRGRGRTQQPCRFYYLFHGEDCAHPMWRNRPNYSSLSA